MRYAMGERPKARTNGTPMLYGLWRRVEFLAEEGELLLLEGESDALTAWLYGLPAVGVPGKTLLKSP
jgi:DNA primase